MPVCSACKSEKPNDAFYANRAKPSGRDDACKECAKARLREHYARNREAVRARQNANVDRAAERARAKRWYEQNRERAAARSARWRAENPHRKADMEQNRRARAGGYWVENVDRLQVLARHDGLCGICGEPVDPDCFDVDHIVPTSRGGTHEYGNVQPAHSACNQGKKNRLMHEYRRATRPDGDVGSPPEAPG